jgi:uncharacterized membrane protein YeaQ/YmgE (transglycosylase-associated protein family)
VLVLAAVQLNPGFGLLGWIVLGLLAGAIASRVVRGRGMGCFADLAVGLLGALVGGFVLSFFVSESQIYGFIGSLVVATLGATVLLFLWRTLVGRH